MLRLHTEAKGEPARQVGKNWSVLAEIPEVESLTAVANRGGATIMAEIRYGWTGERLGHDYAADDKVIVLRDHRYRLCMTIGAQPTKAGPILDDADAGTPQRFVWLRVDDPDCPEERPLEPPRHGLPAWLAECNADADGDADADADGDGVMAFDRNMFLASQLHVPADLAELQVLGIPETARNAVDAHQLAKLRGDSGIDPLDGHKLLCRLKVAAGLMWLNERTDKITEEDWNLAGVVMAAYLLRPAPVSRRCCCPGGCGEQATWSCGKKGERAIEAEEVKRQAAVRRVAENMVRHIQKDGGEMARTKVRNAIALRDREYFDDAEQFLLVGGRITKDGLNTRASTETFWQRPMLARFRGRRDVRAYGAYARKREFGEVR